MGFFAEFSKGFANGFNKAMEEGKERRINSASYQTNKAEIELVNNKIKDLLEERRNKRGGN